MEGDGKDTIWSGGRKFSDGDTITMTVDLGEAEIEWAINEKSQYTYYMPKLRDDTVKWVPFLWMESPGDCLEWL